MASLILVSDMDGTLLDDSSRIPPENIAAIRELIAAGGGFTIATGRPVRSIVDHPALRGLITLPVIACNGACLYDTQKQTYLFARRLPDDVQALAARASVTGFSRGEILSQVEAARFLDVRDDRGARTNHLLTRSSSAARRSVCTSVPRRARPHRGASSSSPARTRGTSRAAPSCSPPSARTSASR